MIVGFLLRNPFTQTYSAEETRLSLERCYHRELSPGVDLYVSGPLKIMSQTIKANIRFWPAIFPLTTSKVAMQAVSTASCLLILKVSIYMRPCLFFLTDTLPLFGPTVIMIIYETGLCQMGAWGAIYRVLATHFQNRHLSKAATKM